MAGCRRDNMEVGVLSGYQWEVLGGGALLGS